MPEPKKLEQRFVIRYLGDPVERFKEYRWIPKTGDTFNPLEAVYILPNHHVYFDLCRELNALGLVWQSERKKTGRGDPWGMTFRDDRAATWMGC